MGSKVEGSDRSHGHWGTINHDGKAGGLLRRPLPNRLAGPAYCAGADERSVTSTETPGPMVEEIAIFLT
jgi:hypothetical protein